MNAWREYISHEIDVSKELVTDFHFLKIHLMSHWVEHIRLYGALQQYSAESHLQAHNTNLKDSWNASNHNLNYLPQVITFQRHILCFKNQRAQSPSPHSASGEQRCRLQSPPFRC
jgi:hypothetical protein